MLFQDIPPNQEDDHSYDPYSDYEEYNQEMEPDMDGFNKEDINPPLSQYLKRNAIDAEKHKDLYTVTGDPAITRMPIQYTFPPISNIPLDIPIHPLLNNEHNITTTTMEYGGGGEEEFDNNDDNEHKHKKRLYDIDHINFHTVEQKHIMDINKEKKVVIVKDPILKLDKNGNFLATKEEVNEILQEELTVIVNKADIMPYPEIKYIQHRKENCDNNERDITRENYPMQKMVYKQQLETLLNNPPCIIKEVPFQSFFGDNTGRREEDQSENIIKENEVQKKLYNNRLPRQCIQLMVDNQQLLREFELNEIKCILTSKEHIEDMNENDIYYYLTHYIKGHDSSISDIAHILVQLNNPVERAINRFLKIVIPGPTGVGKSELMEYIMRLCSVYKGDKYEKCCITLNFSIFRDSTATTTVTGTGPGYIGSDKDTLVNELINALITLKSIKHDKKNKRPNILVLHIIELDKGNNEVITALNHFLDKGIIKNHKGDEFILPKDVYLLMISSSNHASSYFDNLITDDIFNKQKEYTLKTWYNVSNDDNISSIEYYKYITENRYMIDILSNMVKEESRKDEYHPYNIELTEVDKRHKIELINATKDNKSGYDDLKKFHEKELDLLQDHFVLYQLVTLQKEYYDKIVEASKDLSKSLRNKEPVDDILNITFNKNEAIKKVEESMINDQKIQSCDITRLGKIIPFFPISFQSAYDIISFKLKEYIANGFFYIDFIKMCLDFNGYQQRRFVMWLMKYHYTRERGIKPILLLMQEELQSIYNTMNEYIVKYFDPYVIYPYSYRPILLIKTLPFTSQLCYEHIDQYTSFTKRDRSNKRLNERLLESLDTKSNIHYITMKHELCNNIIIPLYILSLHKSDIMLHIANNEKATSFIQINNIDIEKRAWRDVIIKSKKNVSQSSSHVKEKEKVIINDNIIPYEIFLTKVDELMWPNDTPKPNDHKYDTHKQQFMSLYNIYKDDLNKFMNIEKRQLGNKKRNKHKIFNAMITILNEHK